MGHVRKKVDSHFLHPTQHTLVARLHAQGIPQETDGYHRNKQYDETSDQKNILGTTLYPVILAYQWEFLAVSHFLIIDTQILDVIHIRFIPYAISIRPAHDVTAERAAAVALLFIADVIQAIDFAQMFPRVYFFSGFSGTFQIYFRYVNISFGNIDPRQCQTGFQPMPDRLPANASCRCLPTSDRMHFDTRAERSPIFHPAHKAVRSDCGRGKFPR